MVDYDCAIDVDSLSQAVNGMANPAVQVVQPEKRIEAPYGT